MEDDTRAMVEEVKNLTGDLILVHNNKIWNLFERGKRLASVAHTRERKHEALAVMGLAAFAYLQLGKNFDDIKITVLTECSKYAHAFGTGDDVFDMKAAELYRQQHYYGVAGFFFERAAETSNGKNPPAVTLKEDDPRERWQFAIQHYSDAKMCFQIASMTEAAGRCHYRSTVIERDNAQGRRGLGLWLTWLVWGWGERPLHVIACAFGLMAVFGLGYLWAGIEPPPGNFGDALYLSVLTFTTVGYGDYHPATGLGKFFAASEALLGIFFTGLFLVTFVKRYSR
jgi:hypothetical protein